MKNTYTKLFTALLAVILIAGVTIFSCKKEDTIKNEIIPTEWQEKIEYMDIPCVDFSRIKKDVNHAKGAAPMLVFESWDHYANVIEAMLEFTYNYIDIRVQHVRDSIPGIDDDDLSLILHNQGIYQFMPLYSFCQQLQFENSAFPALRGEEVKWYKDSQASSRNNPFDEMEMGYVQSALHNSDGDVMIGNEIFNPKDDQQDGAKGSCDIVRTWQNGGQGGWWPTYNYDGKKREFRAFLKSYNNYSYSKNSVYYFNGLGWRIVWLCWTETRVYGKRLSNCMNLNTGIRSFDGKKKVFASVVEKYEWYTNASKPNYLYYWTYLNDNGTFVQPMVSSVHTAPGKTFIGGM